MEEKEIIEKFDALINALTDFGTEIHKEIAALLCTEGKMKLAYNVTAKPIKTLGQIREHLEELKGDFSKVYREMGNTLLKGDVN